MCCLFMLLVFLGPRFFGAIWWLVQPGRWELAFRDFPLDNLWWIWPILGIVFLPWTTIMFIIVSPNGVTGWEWFWLVLMFLADIASYGGGAGRKRIPGYSGS